MKKEMYIFMKKKKLFENIGLILMSLFNVVMIILSFLKGLNVIGSIIVAIALFLQVFFIKIIIDKKYGDNKENKGGNTNYIILGAVIFMIFGYAYGLI